MNKNIKLADLPRFILDWVDHNSNNVIAVWDRDCQLLFITNSAISILGHQPSQLLGDKWRKFVTAEDQKNLENFVNNDDSTKISRFFIIDKEDNRIQLESTFDKILDPETDEHYVIGVFKSVSHHKETEEMFIQSEKMSIAGQLAAGIAHEIRNPLTSLKGFLQLLQAGINQKEVYYQIMSEEIEKIEMITSELLFISKPMTDKKKVESIHSMIKDVIMLLKSQAQLKNIEIEWSVDKELYTYCDRSQIKQVLINIIKNAIEATEKVGIIKIEVRIINEENIEIDIIDQGPGISDDIIDKIGEPFFTTKQTGTGLGLMITKQLLEQQGGTIQIVKSNTEGSTFRITLPLTTKSLSAL